MPYENYPEPKTPMRFRYVYMGIGSILVMLLAIVSDPDTGFIQNLSIGVSLLTTIVILSKMILYVAMMHLSRKALVDYIDLEDYFKKALETSQGASGALIAVAILMLAISVIMAAVVIR